MPIIQDFPYILLGGDYNPDQWLEQPEIIEADFRLMEEARCNAFSVGIFAWSQLELTEGAFSFSWLDEIMGRFTGAGKKVFLATPSGARPAWLGCDYPETNRVNEQGVRARWGNRHNHCWSSPVMRDKVAVINRKLAERYAGHPALAGWHVGNEYGGECFCELCRRRFQEFLERRYGTVDEFNRRCWTAFWSHRITGWNQLDPLDVSNDAVRLDWRRFNTWQIADFLKWEISALREFSSEPAAANMMGIWPGLDYWRLAECCDFIADDCYPSWYDGKTEETAATCSMMHHMHYAMQKKPFLMIESAPGSVNWKQYDKMRRPNELEREMLLAIGHGADGTMYFQWRKGRGGAEKTHGAVLGHDGASRSLNFRRVSDYGRRLEKLTGVLDSRVSSDSAVIFDWESNWALEETRAWNGGRKRISETIVEHYAGLWRNHLSADAIESGCDFSPYRLLIAPMLYMLKPGVAERLADFVRQGGTLVATYLSAYVNEDNCCFLGGNPGGPPLRELFGVWSEDIDCFEPTVRRSLRMTGPELAGGPEFEVHDFAEYLHAEGAEVAAVYTDDFFGGRPALTVNRCGRGQAWYLGGRTGVDFLASLYGRLAADAGIRPVLTGLPEGVRVSRRSAAAADYYFLYNLTDREQTVTLPQLMRDLWRNGEPETTVVLPPNGASVLMAAGSPS